MKNERKWNDGAREGGTKEGVVAVLATITGERRAIKGGKGCMVSGVNRRLR